MIPHGYMYGRGPIWMQDPSVYMVWGFGVEVILMGIALITTINVITGSVPDFKTGWFAAFVLVGIKYILTFQLFDSSPEIGLAHLLIIQTSVMAVLTTLVLLIYKISPGKAFLGALMILAAQYVMNIIVNMAICAPFFTPSNIDSINRSEGQLPSF